jgi:hypothetical protein
MPQLSWKEIKTKAIEFSKSWEGVENESGESQSFWNAFFKIFGKERRVVASFEEPIKNIRGKYNRIDLFWRGVLLVEHKSKGKRLDAAASQAFQYIQDLAREGRDDESPRYIVVSDFARFAIYDLEREEQEDRNLPVSEFDLQDLHRHVREFGFIRGERVVRPKPEDPANQKAYQLMCELHDQLRDGGFEGQDLEKLLVRILFCLFAEDTGIFEPNAFVAFVESSTRKDGADLGAKLNEFFEVLNTPSTRRQKNLSDELAALPYVNGQLFADRIGFASFTRAMRTALIEAAHFHWARISPAVFGSLFQGVMEKGERRQLGAHYTSERDIMRVIDSLFLRRLRAKFETIREDRSSRRLKALESFQNYLRSLRFLDPACGCGNFLIVAYRELRSLEHDVLFERQSDKRTSQRVLELRTAVQVDIDQFYGIEILEWPTKIAEVAMWLMDHQMNQDASEKFGQSFERLPLKSSPRIICDNALEIDWNDLLPVEECSYILSNPPFVGKKARTTQQTEDMTRVFSGVDGAGVLDYVCAWYETAAKYIYGTKTKVAFVSTSSITQGEQPGVLWKRLFNKYNVHITFAHRTFPWESDAKGKAHVHVVIIGFSNLESNNKTIYEYDGANPEAHPIPAENINPYLVGASNVLISKRSTPLLENVPEMVFGSMPNDGGALLLDSATRKEMLDADPRAARFIRAFVQVDEFLYNKKRWCIWLYKENPSSFRDILPIKQCIDRCREVRQNSKRKGTQKLAATPYLFGEIRQPESKYLLVPRHTGENRIYIPLGFMESEVICGDANMMVPNASVFVFGIMSSLMHMSWVSSVCGRLESRFRYSAEIVYNNFPWPKDVPDEMKQDVENAAQAVLDCRESFFPDACLADLYDPLTMPTALQKAHRKLDRAVDRCYRKRKFNSDRDRLEHLFSLYEKYTSGESIGPSLWSQE